jgi:hypothetical protein
VSDDRDYFETAALNISQRTGDNFSAADFEAWLEGSGSPSAMAGAKRLHAALEAAMPPGLYEAAQNCARTEAVVVAWAAGRKRVTAGGLTFRLVERKGKSK